jgi:hypothetical protein
MALGRFLVETLLPDATMPSPHADDPHRGKRQESGETEPALCPVHIGHDGGYYVLIRSSRRSTKRNNNTTRPALASIQIHLNQP